MNRKGTATRPVGVAYVLPGLGRGGTEKHVLDLASRIDRDRFSPCVINTADDGTMEEDFATGGIPVHRLPYRGISFRPEKFLPLMRDARQFFRGFSRILAQERVAILHAYLPAANVIGPVAGRLARVPRVIVSKRALADYKKRHPGLRRMEPLGNRLADIVLVNSDAVRRDVERTETGWKGKVRKIYNGVASLAAWSQGGIDAFRLREGLPPGVPIAASVANFHPYKGHSDLIEAVAGIAGRFPDAIFLLVGRDSGTLEATRGLARARGIEGSVRFLGERTDVPDLLRASDLFIHPSLEEGFSNAILEAMAAGLPVVACDAGGNAEAVVHGETGLLVPRGDPDSLGAAILALLQDPGRSRAMGRAGRARAGERFSMEGMVKAVEDAYIELLESRPLLPRI